MAAERDYPATLMNAYFPYRPADGVRNGGMIASNPERELDLLRVNYN